MYSYIFIRLNGVVVLIPLAKDNKEGTGSVQCLGGRDDLVTESAKEPTNEVEVSSDIKGSKCE